MKRLMQLVFRVLGVFDWPLMFILLMMKKRQ